MNQRWRVLAGLWAVLVLIAVISTIVANHRQRAEAPRVSAGPVEVRSAVAHDVSPALATLQPSAVPLARSDCATSTGCGTSPADPDADAYDAAAKIPVAPPVGAAAAGVEQLAQGKRPPAALIASFDGEGFGFTGPQGGFTSGNPSDNTLAVGPDHIVQINNGGMAVFTRKGKLFDSTGKALYGTNRSNAIFTGFGGTCEMRNSGDAVVRYDQLARRWLFVLPIFQRSTGPLPDVTLLSRPGIPDQPGNAGPTDLIHAPVNPGRAGGRGGAPPAAAPTTPPAPGQPPVVPPANGRGPGGRGPGGPAPTGPYSMCYAVSVGADPLGPYYRYEFIRPLFPDYPRPAIWPDGYYTPSSTGDNVIQKHACVADRAKMLQGLPATEQCLVIDGVSFLNNADIDGQGLPPAGAPNIMMAAGGSQLRGIFEDDGIYAWKFHVDWEHPERTGVSGPTKIAVAPYHFLCNGQLTNCVPQPDSGSSRLDAQGDKLMQRLVYRNVSGHQSILAEHSINTSAGAGGVRWYEFRLDASGDPQLYQQGTYAPDSYYRWMASMSMDRQGNIGIGYSFGGTPNRPGQRFAGRAEGDALGQLTFHETVLVQGEASQMRANRWEDYTTTAMDPVDDCTFWYVGDYWKANATNYSTKIGAFRFPGCQRATVTGSAFLDLNHDGKRQSEEPGIVGLRVDYAGSESGRITTGPNGNFSISLSADPVYADPTFTFSRPASTVKGWVGAPPPRRVTLHDWDYVTGVDFGGYCTRQNVGGVGADFWLGPKGEELLKEHDPRWRDVVGTVWKFGFTGRGSPPGTFAELYGKFAAWLKSGMADNAPTHTAALAVATALNLNFGQQDGFATVSDPVRNDWASIREVVNRAAELILRPDTSSTSTTQRDLASYATLFANVNSNAVTVTPSKPALCPKPN